MQLFSFLIKVFVMKKKRALHFFCVALFLYSTFFVFLCFRTASYCTVFVLHLFLIALFSCCTVSVLHYLHVVIFSCCTFQWSTFFVLHYFHANFFFMLHSFLFALFCVALFSNFFVLQSFHTILFLCCTFYILHVFLLASFSCCTLCMWHFSPFVLFSIWNFAIL